MQQKDTNSLSAIKKVLIIKGPGIGDVVTAVPLARNFKQLLGCDVHLLEEFPPEKQGKVIISNCPYIDKVARIDYNIWYLRPHSGRFLRELFTLKFIPDIVRFIRDILTLRREKYDLVFEGFPGTRNTFLLTSLIGAKYKICCVSHPARKLYDRSLDIRGKNIVQLENSIFSLFGLNVTEEKLKLEAFLDKNQMKKTADRILDKYRTKKMPIVGINTGHGYKRWQNAKWAKLIDSISGATVVLVGDNGQSSDSKEIQAFCKTKVIDLTGKLRLEETVAVMERMRMFICTNGGLTWIAAALGLPTIAVSGPTPYWWDPRTKNCKVVRKAGKAFYEQEEYSWLQHARTDDVTVDDVINAIKELDKAMKI
ncbi:MAG: glycosyltransferase family 9 protein [Candidatus Aenigmarchaeota archaeon]|nr:glycosyltransferase family 9 protein [Candidatus Aenigmarchaeota archaeon]